ncbi:MAG TPA: TonB-dependent receptor plug domain-containing protein, partial [Terracidiphilus sp.]|nr:TonB-dependent receptor plug domain-containing protein [Terracidiphilus sp.]
MPARCALLLALSAARAQTQTTNADAQDQEQKSQQTALPHVTTTVEVHGEVKDGYLSDAAQAGSLDGVPLLETPLSVSAVSRAVLSDQIARVLSDVVKNDASVAEDYAPVGYYGDYEIRGFTIDLATGLEINGLTIAGEQDVPLENKQSVEIVKGIAGVESGIASSGGLFNYVTKEPRAGMRAAI